jgi:hypothetical protein
MPWELIGNAGTNPANNFLGTTDNQPLAIRINNVESVRATPGGNVGIGTTLPTQKLTLGSGNIGLQNANRELDGNIYFGGRTDAGQTGLRLFGGLVNGTIPAGFIDVQTTDPSDGLRIRVDTGVANTERMRVTASGNVVIGRLPSAVEDVELDVKNDHPLFKNNKPVYPIAIRGDAPYMGVVGTAESYAVFGFTNPDTEGVGVYGRGLLGVFGRSRPGDAVYGETDTGNGVKGRSWGDVLATAAVYGVAEGVNSNGVIGEANNGSNAHAVWGKSTSGYAGYFSGSGMPVVYVSGNLWKGSGGFKIDHPSIRRTSTSTTLSSNHPIGLTSIVATSPQTKMARPPSRCRITLKPSTGIFATN